jgi:hypothetical protein
VGRTQSGLTRRALALREGQVRERETLGKPGRSFTGVTAPTPETGVLPRRLLPYRLNRPEKLREIFSVSRGLIEIG